jgi:predicted DNA-binding transcriptional regulator AlpA
LTEYTFTLTFALGARAADADALIERLGAAGCDDAVVGVGRRGRLALEFTREAEDAARAVGSAVSDVRSAVPDAALIEASPDLVGLSDVASLLGVTRQNVRKLIVSSDAPEPLPVHAGKPTIWRLAAVLRWLAREKCYPIPLELLEVAAATMQVNLAVEARDADPSAQAEIAAFLA